jgi:glycosyltransferase involved in cell wall biosynthesis
MAPQEGLMIRALAVVCVRNEVIHIRRCLAHLIGSGLEVYLIDNESTDGTREIASEFLGRGLIGIESLPWTMEFSLSEQLRAKQRVFATSDHDWIVHADADEWLCSPIEGQSLLEGLTAADEGGYNCVNFHEIVFVPLPGEDFHADDYASRMSTYYFFQPFYPRLNRAWRRSAKLDNSEFGGHVAVGEGLNRSPLDFILRHYVVLSEAQAQEKYVGRRYSDEDRTKGWHRYRLIITPGSLKVKPIPELRRIEGDPAMHHRFDLSMPVKKHFWQW